MRLALAGTFGHWPHVFDECHVMPDVELVGIARVTEEDDPALPQQHPFAGGGVPEFSSPGALLKAQRPDVVIVSARLDRIAPTAIEAARAGCHVICEKPLALNLESLLELHRTLQQTQRRLLAMLTMRTLPVFQTMRRIYGGGAIGRLVQAQAQKSYQWGERPVWFGDKARYGGTIGWVGIHGLDMILATTGESFRSVTTLKGNAAHPERPGCEDYGTLLLQLSGGGAAAVTFDYFRPASAPTHDDDRLRLVGTDGVLEGNASEEWVRLINADGTQYPELDSKYPLYRSFLEELTRGAAPNAMTLQADPFYLTWVCLQASDAGQEWGPVADFPWPHPERVTVTKKA